GEGPVVSPAPGSPDIRPGICGTLDSSLSGVEIVRSGPVRRPNRHPNRGHGDVFVLTTVKRTMGYRGCRATDRPIWLLVTKDEPVSFGQRRACCSFFLRECTVSLCMPTTRRPCRLLEKYC